MAFSTEMMELMVRLIRYVLANSNMKPYILSVLLFTALYSIPTTVTYARDPQNDLQSLEQMRIADEVLIKGSTNTDLCAHLTDYQLEDPSGMWHYCAALMTNGK